MTMRYLTMVLLLGAPAVASAQATLSTERMAELDVQLPALIKKHHIAAIAVAVVREGRVIWTGAWGEQAPGVPATTQTLFNVASMAKPISAEVIARLVAAGNMSYDESMAPTWVDPDIAADPRHTKLTPRIALSHQTGFPNWRRMNKDGRLAFLVDPGTRFGYSGEGYNYVARFAEKKTGRGFETLADELVFQPIGLKSISYSRRDWMEDRIAMPFDSAGQWGKPDLSPAGQWKAADNVFTTVGDYAAFMISVMNGERLTDEVATERMRAQVDIGSEWPCVVKPADQCPKPAGMALGWFRFDYGPESVIWHGGDDWGEHSMAMFYPGTRDGYVVAVNGGNGRYAVIDALDLLDDRSPVPAFAKAGKSPVAVWLRALLDAAYAGTLPGQKKQ